MTLMRQKPIRIESPKERRRRVSLENTIKRRARTRYRIQLNLSGPNDGKIFPKCSLPFLCSTKEEAWAYIEKIDIFGRFPEARSASVEYVRFV